MKTQPALAPEAAALERILVVDDEPGILKMAARMLESAGYRVMSAGTGREALALLNQTSDVVDLMITDVIMPAVMGPDLADAVRKQHPTLKVIFTSGETDTGTRTSGLGPGTPFLAKPYSKAELLRRVRQVLDDQAA